jgi:hypothetical protein
MGQARLAATAMANILQLTQMPQKMMPLFLVRIYPTSRALAKNWV